MEISNLKVQIPVPPQSLYYTEDKPTLIHFEVFDLLNVESRGANRTPPSILPLC